MPFKGALNGHSDFLLPGKEGRLLSETWPDQLPHLVVGTWAFMICDRAPFCRVLLCELDRVSKGVLFSGI